jgi:hypothetical protein
MTLHLRQARNRALNHLKTLEPHEQILEAGKHIPLFELTSWPIWLDKDLIEMVHTFMATPTMLARTAQKDAKRIKQNGWTHLVGNLMNTPTVRFRLFDPTAPDRHEFWRILAQRVGQLDLVHREPAHDPIAMNLPFLPRAEDTLGMYGPIWICDSDDEEDDRTFPLSVLAHIIELGCVYNIVKSELEVLGESPPPQALGAFVRTALRQGAFLSGSWLDDRWTSWTVRKLMKTYGDDLLAPALLAMMETTDDFLKEVAQLGQTRLLTLTEDKRTHVFSLDHNNQCHNDPSGWRMLALRGGIVSGMSGGGAAVVERLRNLDNNGHRVKDVFAAQLGDETWGWLTADECRSVHLYNYATGESMPRNPGHVYRGFD